MTPARDPKQREFKEPGGLWGSLGVSGGLLWVSWGSPGGILASSMKSMQKY